MGRSGRSLAGLAAVCCLPAASDEYGHLVLRCLSGIPGCFHWRCLGTAVLFLRGLQPVLDRIDASGGMWQRGAMIPKDSFVSEYGVENALGLEYWAEAVATWVYGSRYQSQGPGRTEPLTVSQSDWIARVLKGWGW